MSDITKFDRLQQLKQSDSCNSFSFYRSDDNSRLCNIKYIMINNRGEIDKVINIENDIEITYTKDNFYYYQESLFVLGIGNLLPGDIVKLRHLDYSKFELKFGWHTNISNQTIYSWYLEPIAYESVYNVVCESVYDKDIVYKNDNNILTLYKEYLDTIEVVEYRNDRNYFYKK